MSDVNVLVVFHSRHGRAERLALAAGLGAIQARGKIRLRRLASLADVATIGGDAEWQANVERQQRDYVTPRPADLPWAHVVILAAPPGGCPELEQFLSALDAGAMAGKIAAPLSPESSAPTLSPVYAACALSGATVVPAPIDPADPLTAARLFGQRVSEISRRLRAAN